MQLAQDRLRAVGVHHRGGFGHLHEHLRRINAAGAELVLDPLRQVGLPELAWRQIESDLQIDVQLAPRLDLVGELSNDPIADLLDQSELFRERDEVVRWNHRPVGFDPSDQGFDAEHQPRVEVDDRLIVQHPSLQLHGLAQAGDERELRRRVQRAPWCQDEARAAVALGLVHRRLGVPQEGSHVVGVIGEQADAGARGDVHLGATDVERRDQRILDPLRDTLRPHDGAVDRAVIAVEIGEQQEELVAAATRDQIRLARRVAEPVGDRRQERVAGLVPQRVVHEPELVEIDAQDRDRTVVASGPRDRELEQLLEHRARRQPGELVVIRLEGGLLLGPLAVRDVHDHAVRIAGHAPLVTDHHRLVVHPHHMAVLGEHPVLQAERLPRLVVPCVLRQGSRPVVRMDQARPHLGVLDPFLGGVAEELGHLGTHVDRGGALFDPVDVGDRGAALDHRAVEVLTEPRILIRALAGRGSR